MWHNGNNNSNIKESIWDNSHSKSKSEEKQF